MAMASARQPLGELSARGNLLNSSKPSATDGKKRKAPDESDSNTSDDDVCPILKLSCDEVRSKIREFIDSKEMKVCEFYTAIGATKWTYGVFMKQNGIYEGFESPVYRKAFTFFKTRESNGVQIKKRKVDPPKNTSKTAKASIDFGDIMLEGEEENEVPVYDSCDEIRMKISDYLSETSMSQAQFSRELGQMVNPKKATVSGLAPFLSRSGPAAGNTTQVFYCGYVFFEKMRIREKEPKSEHRLGMEDAWDGCEPWGKDTPGMEVKKMIDRETYIVPAYATYELYQDEFGKPIRGW